MRERGIHGVGLREIVTAWCSRWLVRNRMEDLRSSKQLSERLRKA